METLFTNFVEETNCMRSEEEEEVENIEDEEKVKDDSQTEELTIKKQQKPTWACYFYKTNRDVYCYAGLEIFIQGSFDSYAGMTWPAALALCHYLDTHREQLNLVDKAVLEIGAGTGLVSVVAALLGAWVTATDIPDVLNNLRVNLSRNTRGHCRHTPQVAALTWDFDLESTYPSSVYRYNYVLAADVVYHHDFLDELLATMKHFCKPGTTLIWANKVRFESDLTFTDKFKKAFQTGLLFDDGDIKIFVATCREEEEEDNVRLEELLSKKGEQEREEKEEDEENKAKCLEETCNEDELQCVSSGKESDNNKREEPLILETEQNDGNREENEHRCIKKEEVKGTDQEDENDREENRNLSCSTTAGDEDITGHKQTVVPAWAPTVICSFGKDIYHYAGQDIVIYESIDSYGAVMWPAALALCSFLDNNRKIVDLQGKKVLELGAGTGLVSIVASLLGASVTTTDLPEVLSNLRANVMRNTRGCCRYTPQVEVLTWCYDLESTYPSSTYRYDYVLAADVVYHHDFLDELLATMKHFCKPGTTVIWANKVRFESDLTFTDKFKKAFHTSLLAEDGDMKIFMATCRE